MRDTNQLSIAFYAVHLVTVRQLEYLTPSEGYLVLQTMRSHDQYNTTFYGLDDRYRGIKNGRSVILIIPDDLQATGFNDGDMVDVFSMYQGEERRADAFRLVSYPTVQGCVAAYFPEANVLVHQGLVARESNTPGFKAIMVRFEPSAQGNGEDAIPIAEDTPAAV